MENFSGGMNPNIGKKFITLEDGSSIEAPDGVRDEKDYKEFLAEQAARAGEAAKQKEADERREAAMKLASKIENSVDEKLVKSSLASGNYDAIVAAIAGVDGVPMKGDQVRIDQDGRKLGEAHDRYDAVIGEAMEILRNEYFGEEALKASEMALVPTEVDGSEEGAEDTGNRQMMLDALTGEGAEWLRDGIMRHCIDVLGMTEDMAHSHVEMFFDKLSSAGDEQLTATYNLWIAHKKGEDMPVGEQLIALEGAMIEGMEGEKSREEMLDELLTPEGERWLATVKGIDNLGSIMEMSDEEIAGLYDELMAGKPEDEEGKEKEKSREEMLDEFFTAEGEMWLGKVKGIESLGDVKNLSDEELAGLYAEWVAHKDEAEGESDEDAEGKEGAEKKPLVAVDIDRTRDAEAAARDIAEKMLKEDLASGGKVSRFLKGIWKGNMFRGYYVEKNKKLAYNRILEKQRGENSGLGDEHWQSRSEATIDRFISEYDEMIHGEAGEWRDALPDNHPAAEAARKAISEFAQGNLDETNFMQEMGRVKAMLKDKNGNPKGEVVLDNYLEIARAAKGRFEHEEGIDSIMEGFKLINGEARANVRTEAHMNSLDKIMDKYEHGRFSRFVPPELVAGAASVGIWLAQAGTKNALRAATFGLGGAAVTGLAAGIKEGARVSTDRAQAIREAASGLLYDKTGKYDRAIHETVYDMVSAADTASRLSEAAKSGDKNLLVRVLAQADARTKMSDTRSIDLIAYSDPTKIEEERFALDLARAEARVALRKLDTNADAVLNELVAGVETVLDDEGGIKAKDAAFKKLRRKQMIKQGLKTAAVAAGTMVVTQEVVAAFSPDSYGVADKVFNLENNADASKTMLAGMLGLNGPDGMIVTGTERVDAEEAAGVKLTDEEVARLKEQGYTVNEIENTTLQSQEVQMSASEYAREYGTPVNRDDWGSNGTTAFDGNELNAHYTTNGDGIVTRMSGDSTTWGGESINFQEAVEDGKIRAFISLTKDSQATPIEVTGQIVNNGAQIEFIPEPGSAAAECFQDGKFVGKYFEIVFDNGVAEDGTQHIIPLATLVGQGVEGTLAGTVDAPVTETLYNVIGYERTIDAVQTVGDGVINPAAALPFVRRENLRNARRVEQSPGGTVVEPTSGGEGTTPEEPEQNPTGEGTEGEGTVTQPTEGEPAGDGETPAAEEGGEPAGEQQPAEMTPETQQTTPEQSEYDENGEPIWENMAGKLGGERGLWLVRGGLDTAPEDWRNSEYQLWWNDLSDEVKGRFSRGDSSSDGLTPASGTLRDWLQATGKLGESAIPAGEEGEAA